MNKAQRNWMAAVDESHYVTILGGGDGRIMVVWDGHDRFTVYHITTHSPIATETEVFCKLSKRNKPSIDWAKKVIENWRRER